MKFPWISNVFGIYKILEFDYSDLPLETLGHELVLRSQNLDEK